MKYEKPNLEEIELELEGSFLEGRSTHVDKEPGEDTGDTDAPWG